MIIVGRVTNFSTKNENNSTVRGRRGKSNRWVTQMMRIGLQLGTGENAYFKMCQSRRFRAQRRRLGQHPRSVLSASSPRALVTGPADADRASLGICGAERGGFRAQADVA